ncbi:MAG: DUF692 domain-containing protein [Bacillota bacterium]
MKYQSSAYKVGTGLRSSHYSYLEQRPATEASWFEATSEEYLDTRGRPFEILKMVRHDYPVAFHGLGLNLGCIDGVRLDYLRKLHDLAEQVEPFIISDHIGWTGYRNHNMHDLLPLPLTQGSLQILSENIDLAQSYLKTTLLVENISTYLNYRHNEMTEWEFMKELSRQTGCGILLDLSSVYVNSQNYGFNPKIFLDHLPMEHVRQIHLGGPTNHGDFLVNTRANEVSPPVWDLLKYVAAKVRHLPIAIERDGNIPAFNDLEMEIIKASFILENSYDNERRAESV